MGNPNYKNGFELTIHEHLLKLPFTWKTPRTIFVNSMSDLFHEDIPFEFIYRVFNTMRKAHWHTFQILTKRSERLLELDSKIDWPLNVWMGVSVENEGHIFRIDHLRQAHAQIKFISFEPLLGPLVNIDLNGIHWVIVGGESGPGARLIKEKWVCDIRDNCLSLELPFFFKQWGGTNKKQNGRVLQGETWDEVPESMGLFI